MNSLLILQHVAHEGPGRLASVCRDLGLRLDTRHLYRGDDVPRDLSGHCGMVSMGGPMGVSDVGRSEFAFLADEVRLIGEAIRDNRPFMGFCLGAQLLAHAAGAKVMVNTIKTPQGDVPAPEVGWGAIQLPFPGGTEPLMAGLRDGEMMFHWHMETFELPRVGTAAAGSPPPPTVPLLASTRVCRNQAFRLRTRLVGLQFHPEMTRDGIEAMLTCDAGALPKAQTTAEAIRGDSAKHFCEYEAAGNRLLSNLVGLLIPA